MTKRKRANGTRLLQLNHLPLRPGVLLKPSGRGIVLIKGMCVDFLECSFPGTHFECGRYRLAIAVDGGNTGKGGVLHLTGPYFLILHLTSRENAVTWELCITGGLKGVQGNLIL